jgi:hypothetical protein
VTLTFPDIHQAVEFYLTASLVADVDDYENFDEDAHARGGGMSYLVSLKGRTYFRFLADYQQIRYDSRAWDYLNESSPDRRSDNLTSLGLEQNLQLTQRLDFMARYTFVHTHSNVAVYDYDQHIVQAGLSVSF